MKTRKLRIRYRWRSVASARPGRRGSWGEYQVIDGRAIIARFDLLAHAKARYPDAEDMTS